MNPAPAPVTLSRFDLDRGVDVADGPDPSVRGTIAAEETGGRAGYRFSWSPR